MKQLVKFFWRSEISPQTPDLFTEISTDSHANNKYNITGTQLKHVSVLNSAIILHALVFVVTFLFQSRNHISQISFQRFVFSVHDYLMSL